MERDIANTLEALANLLYLARRSLDFKETADAYLALAEDVIKTAACLPARSGDITGS